MESPVFNPCRENVGPFGRIVGREFLGECAREMDASETISFE